MPARSADAIFFYSTIVFAVVSWIVLLVPLAYAQAQYFWNFYDDDFDYASSYDDDLLFETYSATSYSSVWWAFGYETFLIAFLVALRLIPNRFNALLPVSLVLVSIWNNYTTLSIYIFETTSYIRAINAGSAMLAIVGFVWLFYYSYEKKSAILADEVVDDEKAVENATPAAVEPAAVEPDAKHVTESATEPATEPEANTV
ncbi:hypothetical protein DASC09_059300 [Saccharomycopsis crataegensis]|uniref:Uncharacterized protein n=1 Tax=Saccharomycopsis crataegensis TaxID=43959 RepID=A0AAV5QV68_9ASCO|nr:hypothetical protein DASC09_059300 [Saccharomycopsis crataegensis]